jgi:hypothetical protein
VAGAAWLCTDVFSDRFAEQPNRAPKQRLAAGHSSVQCTARAALVAGRATRDA